MNARGFLPESVRREMEERDREEAEDLKNAPSRVPKQGEMSGRQSGALEWRAARGEIQMDGSRSVADEDDLDSRIESEQSLYGCPKGV